MFFFFSEITSFYCSSFLYTDFTTLVFSSCFYLFPIIVLSHLAVEAIGHLVPCRSFLLWSQIIYHWGAALGLPGLKPKKHWKVTFESAVLAGSFYFTDPEFVLGSLLFWFQVYLSNFGVHVIHFNPNSEQQMYPTVIFLKGWHSLIL